MRQLFGERKGLAHQAGHALSQGIVEALDVIGFARVLRDGAMLRCRKSIGKSNSLFHRRRAPLTRPRSARRTELLKRRPRTSGTVCPWGKAKAEWFKRLGLAIAARRRLIQTSGTVVMGQL